MATQHDSREGTDPNTIKIENMKTQQKALQSKHDKLQKNLDDKTKEIKALEVIQDKLQNDLTGKDKKITELDRDLNQKTDAVVAKTEEIEELQDDLKKKDQKIADVEGKNKTINILKEENETKKNRYWWIGIGILIGGAVAGYFLYTRYYSESALFKRNLELQMKNDSKDFDISRLKDKIQIYKAHDLKDRDGQVGALQDINDKYYNQLQTAQKKINSLKSQQQHASQQQVELLQNTVNDQKIRYQSLEFKYNTLEERFNSINKEDWQLKIEEALGEKNDLKLKNQDLSKQIKALNVDITNIEKLLPSRWGLILSYLGSVFCAYVVAWSNDVVQNLSHSQVKEAVGYLSVSTLCMSLYSGWLVSGGVWSHWTRKKKAIK